MFRGLLLNNYYTIFVGFANLIIRHGCDTQSSGKSTVQQIRLGNYFFVLGDASLFVQLNLKKKSNSKLLNIGAGCSDLFLQVKPRLSGKSWSDTTFNPEKITITYVVVARNWMIFILDSRSAFATGIQQFMPFPNPKAMEYAFNKSLTKYVFGEMANIFSLFSIHFYKKNSVIKFL